MWFYFIKLSTCSLTFKPLILRFNKSILYLITLVVVSTLDESLSLRLVKHVFEKPINIIDSDCEPLGILDELHVDWALHHAGWPPHLYIMRDDHSGEVALPDEYKEV